MISWIFLVALAVPALANPAVNVLTGQNLDPTKVVVINVNQSAAPIVHEVFLANSSPGTIQNVLLTPVQAVNATNSAAVLSTEINCGDPNVTCHGVPGGCVAQDWKTCEVLAKIKSEGDHVFVDLKAQANKPLLKLNFDNRWIGLGFSKSGGMPKTAVVHCFKEANQIAPTTKLTFNVPDAHFNQGWEGIDQSVLQLVKSDENADVLHCSANLKKHFKILEWDYDLSQDHVLLAATGRLRDGAIAKHDRRPAISEISHHF